MCISTLTRISVICRRWATPNPCNCGFLHSTDSDGNNGDDNSYYSPALKRLSFGHGGVDDDEDAM
jgi:hypothetical protein